MPYNDLRKGRVSCPNQLYFITVTTNGRIPHFSDFRLGREVVNELRRLHDEEKAFSLAWVLMPDHLHWLFRLGQEENLAEVMKLLKGRSAQRVNKVLRRRGSVWQRAYYDHALREEEDIRQIARYMIANPLRAGLVSEIGKYPLWDAIWVNGPDDLCE